MQEVSKTIFINTYDLTEIKELLANRAIQLEKVAYKKRQGKKKSYKLGDIVDPMLINSRCATINDIPAIVNSDIPLCLKKNNVIITIDNQVKERLINGSKLLKDILQNVDLKKVLNSDILNPNERSFKSIVNKIYGVEMNLDFGLNIEKIITYITINLVDYPIIVVWSAIEKYSKTATNMIINGDKIANIRAYILKYANEYMDVFNVLGKSFKITNTDVFLKNSENDIKFISIY